MKTRFLNIIRRLRTFVSVQDAIFAGILVLLGIASVLYFEFRIQSARGDYENLLNNAYADRDRAYDLAHSLGEDLRVYRNSAVLNQAIVITIMHGEKWEAKLDHPERFKGASDRNDTIEQVREIAHALVDDKQQN